MHKAPKRAKKSGQLLSSVGPQPVLMASVNFIHTTDQVGVSLPHKWSEIYDFVTAAKPSNKSPLMAIRDSDEEFNDIDIYDELLKVQRSEIHKIALRPIMLPITDVMQGIAMQVDF